MTAVLADSDWRDLAACREVDPELFFAAPQADAAKAVCASCPVRVPCLDWAMRHSMGYGVWGATAEEERRTPGAPAVRTSALCDSGRHLHDGPGRCLKCRREFQRERQRTRVRDQADVYARRVARATEASEASEASAA